ncbi:MAG: iron-sulfur protein [Clostridia bacterium]|jgi:multimeric flavodoxin WrbA|nr:iron-sulfur protein [Clostridia bacterium]MBT7121718.1 iron-sulfur protein [Clostridia bacterium]
MKIAVLSGSPKGKYSITLQSALYLQHHNPGDEFEIFHVGQKIRKYEDSAVMGEIIDALAAADVILFAYPVYTFLATYQMARFIELMKLHPKSKSLSGKFATQITTSKHFYDYTAHRYVQDNCADMGLKYITGLPADMDDLLLDSGIKQINDFYKRLRFCVENDMYEKRTTPKVKPVSFDYNSAIPATDKSADFRAVIVSDCEDNNSMLRSMIDAFVAAFPYNVDEFNLAEFKFSGGCLGCFKCAADGTCVYKDNFENVLRERILTGDAIIYATTIRDHSLGTKTKNFHDRQFCNGHRVMTHGKVVGYILDGEISKEHNLYDVIDSRSDVSNMFLGGVATNESRERSLTDASIATLAKTTAFALRGSITKPQSFFGVGGTKVFRDLIYLMQGIMKADHKYYKKHGVYDFPHKRYGFILKMKILGVLMRNKVISKKIGNRVNVEMMKPYTKAILRSPKG